MKAVAASLILLTSMCHAQAAERPLDEIKRGVAGAVERHAISAACHDIKVSPQDVMALAPTDSAESVSKFVVVWTDPTGCTGKSGTHIAIATVDGGDYIIDERLSTLVEEFDDDVSYLQRVVNHSADSLTLEGKTYGPYDSNKPSIPVRYTLRMDDDSGRWKIADKIKLPFAL